MPIDRPSPIAPARGARRDASPGTIRVAILDLNNGHPNQGMRCLREILEAHDGRLGGASILWDEFDVRGRGHVPGLDYDVYLSSGGPGSPFDGEGTAWEATYFRWIDGVLAHNAGAEGSKKHVFFVCHSFELLLRHLGLARLELRRSESFGIFPVHPTEAGTRDVIFGGLGDPFYGADFRSWQAVEPDAARLAELGASVLAIEKDRPHVGLERALMAMRVTPELVGTQFHPEADPDGMLLHFREENRRATIVERHGEEKYAEILHHIMGPSFLERTHDCVLPNFLRDAACRLREAPMLEPA